MCECSASQIELKPRSSSARPSTSGRMPSSVMNGEIPNRITPSYPNDAVAAHAVPVDGRSAEGTPRSVAREFTNVAGTRKALVEVTLPERRPPEQRPGWRSRIGVGGRSSPSVRKRYGWVRPARWVADADGESACAADPCDMTAWIVFLALTVAFSLAVRHGRPNDVPLPPGRDGERLLAELQARGASYTGAYRL